MEEHARSAGSTAVAERGAKPNVHPLRAARPAGDLDLHLAAAARRLPRADQPAVVDARAPRPGRGAGPRGRRRDDGPDPPRSRLARPRARVSTCGSASTSTASATGAPTRSPPTRAAPTASSRSRRSWSRRARSRRTSTASCKPGAIISLSDVEGQFVLPDPRPERILFISAGSGITPIMAMLRCLEREDALDDVVHLHSAPRRRRRHLRRAAAGDGGAKRGPDAARAAHPGRRRADPPRRPRRALPRLARARDVPLRPGRADRRLQAALGGGGPRGAASTSSASSP